VTDLCPCGTTRTYDECCAPAHAGAAPPTAEALMRSRYSAFARGDADHLLRTWHRSTRPARLTVDGRQRWTRLRILATERGGPADADGTVEFRAHFRAAGEPGSLHERSRFVRENGEWFYIDGTIDP
jgi:SEC-C motif-containing protein